MGQSLSHATTPSPILVYLKALRSGCILRSIPVMTPLYYSAVPLANVLLTADTPGHDG